MRAGTDHSAEWLETDGLGGFASGTVGLVRSRRYHALLLAATTPPTGRFVLVNGVEAHAATPAGTFALSSQRYLPDVVHPDGARRIETFDDEPWPRWRFRLEDGTRIEQEVITLHGAQVVALSWRLVEARPGVSLAVRPLLSGRDFHALHRENGAFRFAAEESRAGIVWRPYASVPGIRALSNGTYAHEPLWYRNFLYADERARGLDHVEDLASPGVLEFDLTRGPAALVLASEDAAGADRSAGRLLAMSAEACLARIRAGERRRRAEFPDRLQRAAGAYLARRGSGLTVVAGYPWFADWGRDTFVALRGLCLATGHLAEARAILLAWARAVSRGMLPNRFPDRGDEPEYNAVDASLWYVVAAQEYLAAAVRRGRDHEMDRKALLDAVRAILSGYAAGTRYGIRADADGLLAAGEPGTQLTWMDARAFGREVTPRIGKPVEVQALWLNALAFGGTIDRRFSDLRTRGVAAFRERFWNSAAGFLYDVVDVDHHPGAVDPTLRPNQILAVGGLPLSLLEGEKAARVVAVVEERLLTPLGLRTLDPGSPAYRPRCDGGPDERDGAYHQGTAWPWLLGPFVEAWVRVRGATPAARAEARARFLDPLLRHLDAGGLGHLPEIADGDPPHAPRGCPFQAWSVGEALRLQAQVLAEPGSSS